MPVPTPGKNEPKEKFIGRCIRTLEKEDPDRPHKQIIAICFSKWREKDKKKEEVSWVDEVSDFYEAMISEETGKYNNYEELKREEE